MSDRKKVLVIGDTNLTSNILDEIEESLNLRSLFKIKRKIGFGKNILSREIAHNIEQGIYHMVITGPLPHKIANMESRVSFSNWLRNMNVPFIEAKTASGQIKITRESYLQALIELKRLGTASTAS